MMFWKMPRRFIQLVICASFLVTALSWTTPTLANDLALRSPNKKNWQVSATTLLIPIPGTDLICAVEQPGNHLVSGRKFKENSFAKIVKRYNKNIASLNKKIRKLLRRKPDATPETNAKLQRLTTQRDALLVQRLEIINCQQGIVPYTVADNPSSASSSSATSASTSSTASSGESSSADASSSDQSAESSSSSAPNSSSSSSISSPSSSPSSSSSSFSSSSSVSSISSTSSATSSSSSLSSSSSSTGTNCSTSTTAWQNRAFSQQSGVFTVQFDATPNGAPIDGVTGLSLGAANSYPNLAATVRFNTQGKIDARNGGGYTSATNISYSAGLHYQFRLVVNVPAHTYSAYVTPQGGAEQIIGLNYGFRSEQTGVTSLNNLTFNSSIGNHAVCALSISDSSSSSSSSSVSSSSSTSSSSSSATSSSTSSSSSSSSSSTQSCDAIAQHGITVTFDTALPTPRCGQFVNNDWWVAPAIGSTSVKIASISPAPANGRNGWQIDPLPGRYHAYDNRQSNNYSDALLPPSSAWTIQVSQAEPIRSLVFTISNPEQTQCDIAPTYGVFGWYDYTGGCNRAYLKTAIVITVLNSPPPANSFRPHYAKNSKVIHSSNNLHTELLLSLPLVGSPPTVSSLVRDSERVWLDHVTGSAAARFTHPIDNMPDYGDGMAQGVGEFAMMLLSNSPNKQDLLENLIQFGIDSYGNVINGGGQEADGGHASGRKFPILFAGIMLDYAPMKQIGFSYPAWSQNPALGDKFGEDCQTTYDSNDFPRFYLRGCQYPDDPASFDNGENSSYRYCCTSHGWIGYALAARLLSLEEEWNHQPFFDYVDRWMHEENSATPTWIKSMWNTYRTTANTCYNHVQDSCSVACSAEPNQPPFEFIGETAIDAGGDCG